MGSFSYEAVDNRSGKAMKGNMDADDIKLVYAHIKSHNWTAITVQEENTLTKDISFGKGKKVTSRDLSVFCRQFVSMVSAGVTIVDALTMLTDQTENKTLAAAVDGVKKGIQKGDTMADSMMQYPKAFPSLLIHMVKAGEASGSLEKSFERMAVQFEKSAKLTAMVKKAMIYPIIVAFVAVGVVIVMLTFVVPSYTSMFQELDVELPAITKSVIVMSNFILHDWFILLGVVLAVVFGKRAFQKTEAGQEFFGNLAIHSKIRGQLTVKTASSRFARTLSTLLAAGMPMMDALDIVADSQDNIWFKRALVTAREEVAKGIPLSVPLKECKIFPPMVYHMVGIGEETGDIESMLEKLADYYDEEVEIATQAVMAALEPMIILLLAAIVGYLIAAVISPMVAMYSGLDKL